MTHHLSTLFATYLLPNRIVKAAGATLLGGLLWLALCLPLLAQDGGTLIYTVQPGETLSEIAAQFDVDAADLLALNGLEDANAIFVGQQLRVPVTALNADQPAPPGTHRVQPGETLSEIAKRYGLTLAELMALNQLDDANAVIAGQLLAIGTAVSAADAAPADIPTDEPTATPDESGADGAPASDQPPAVESTPLPLPETHTVQPGETLTAIARLYGIPAATIKALNNLGDEDFIVVGQQLTLSVAVVQEEATPAPEEVAVETPEETADSETPVATPSATPSETPAETPAAIPSTHTVQVGETLTGIARRYGLTLDTLQARNGIRDENAIYVGQELILAAPTPEPTAGPPPDATAEAPSAEAETPTGESSTAADTAGTDTAADTPQTGMAETGMSETAIVRSGSSFASLNRTYTVLYGDTLGRIALREGVAAAALASLNHYDSVDAPLSAGATLLLPATGDELRPSTPAQAHIVAAGESLSGIAQDYDTTTSDLMAANRISDANAIYPGQRLLIPSQPLGGSDALMQQVGPASSGYFFYTVQPGDTLSAIAKQFDSTMEALRTYNGLPDNETVYTGLELKIPFGPPTLPLDLPPAPMSGTRFVVSLSRQQCWVFEGDKVRYAWQCSTGIGERKTKPGNYAVQSKITNAKSKVWRLDMPYWLGIYDVGEVENGIHGLPMAWSTGKKIWSGLIGQPATFGCAMLDDANASTLFRMAFLGMPVHVVN